MVGRNKSFPSKNSGYPLKKKLLLSFLLRCSVWRPSQRFCPRSTEQRGKACYAKGVARAANSAIHILNSTQLDEAIGGLSQMGMQSHNRLDKHKKKAPDYPVSGTKQNPITGRLITTSKSLQTKQQSSAKQFLTCNDTATKQ